MSIPITFVCNGQTIQITNKYKYLGLWIDEHFTMKTAVKELSKSANRALGALTAKFIDSGGMTNEVFTKIYESLVDPVPLCCAEIWCQSEQSIINTVQNRAMKLFLGVNKNTSNVGKLGDLDWKSCLTKQRIEVFRTYIRLESLSHDRLLHKVHQWSVRRNNSWDARVLKLSKKLNINDIVTNSTIHPNSLMKLIKDKLLQHDNTDWFSKMWDDRNGVNKLRTHRTFKKD